MCSLTRLGIDVRTALVESRTETGGVMAGEELILDEAMDNLKEATQRIRATQNRL